MLLVLSGLSLGQNIINIGSLSNSVVLTINKSFTSGVGIICAAFSMQIRLNIKKNRKHSIKKHYPTTKE